MGSPLNLSWAMPFFLISVPRQPKMSPRSTSSRLSALWAVLSFALIRQITGRGSTQGRPSHSAPNQIPSVSKEPEPPAAEVIEQHWTAFLKRDVGWGFGILYLLAMMQAAFFAYDQILNDSALETAAVSAISQQWQRLRSR